MSDVRIAMREQHIIDLARIVAARAGEPKPDAIRVRIVDNNVKCAHWSRCDACGDEYDEGDAQWNALAPDDDWSYQCRYCLPGRIERGEATLHRLSAHSILALMLAGLAGFHEYLRHFHDEAEVDG